PFPLDAAEIVGHEGSIFCVIGADLVDECLPVVRCEAAPDGENALLVRSGEFTVGRELTPVNHEDGEEPEQHQEGEIENARADGREVGKPLGGRIVVQKGTGFGEGRAFSVAFHRTSRINLRQARVARRAAGGFNRSRETGSAGAMRGSGRETASLHGSKVLPTCQYGKCANCNGCEKATGRSEYTGSAARPRAGGTLPHGLFGFRSLRVPRWSPVSFSSQRLLPPTTMSVSNSACPGPAGQGS